MIQGIKKVWKRPKFVWTTPVSDVCLLTLTTTEIKSQFTVILLVNIVYVVMSWHVIPIETGNSFPKPRHKTDPSSQQNCVYILVNLWFCTLLSMVQTQTLEGVSAPGVWSDKEISIHLKLLSIQSVGKCVKYIHSRKCPQPTLQILPFSFFFLLFLLKSSPSIISQLLVGEDTQKMDQHWQVLEV